MFGMIALASVFAAALTGTALGENSSVYTEVDLSQCPNDKPDPNAELPETIWHCAGHNGIPVWIKDSDARTFVSYGENAADEPAAQKTVPSGAFNSVGPRIEWRLDSAGRPFATILRFVLANEIEQGSVLIVTRLGSPGETCHIAYIDADETPNANDIARQLADELAENFRCGESVPSQL